MHLMLMGFSSSLGQTLSLVRLGLKQRGQGSSIGGQTGSLKIKACQPVATLGEHLKQSQSRDRRNRCDWCNRLAGEPHGRGIVIE